MDIIEQNCDFIFYYNKSDITPTVLDRGNEKCKQNGQLTNILFALSLMIHQLKFKVIHMYW